MRGGSGAAPGARPGTVREGAAKLALKGRTRLAKALRSGFAVRVSGAKAGKRIKLTARSSGKLVARGSATARARPRSPCGCASPRPAARRSSASATAKLVVSGGTVRGTVTLRR